MSDNDAKTKKPQLPAGAPKGYDPFLECTAATLTIKAGKVGWVGKIDLDVTEIEPEMSFEAGERGAINISVGKACWRYTAKVAESHGFVQIRVDGPKCPNTTARSTFGGLTIDGLTLRPGAGNGFTPDVP